MTIVVGDDLVCRLGFSQVNKFKREVVSCLLQCDMNKGVEPASLDLILDKGVPAIEWPEMHMPGKILHFIREGKRAESTVCTHPRMLVYVMPLQRFPLLRRYQMFWTSPEYFDHLVVSPRCFKDHMPDVVYDALRSVCTVTAL
ncbi:hypothetical protein HPB52_006523 [Rhipicephalus sanguineus]|uniref:Uncharacterized protein n=1 Tax=Rhipicephalus sanguineus TaxID=34632 RepID=A0A9D4SRT4_RHISA|nr:hypothetical protein HPB52_006523 [Rhipicephalus sanguineus]